MVVDPFIVEQFQYNFNSPEVQTLLTELHNAFSVYELNLRVISFLLLGILVLGVINLVRSPK